MAGTSLNDDLKTLGMSSHAELQKQIEKTRDAYERLRASGTLTGAELAQAAFKAEERIRELKSQTGGLADSLSKARTAFGGLVSSGEGIATVVNQAIAFESAMAEVSRTVDGSEEQIAALGSRIKELATEIPGGVEGLTQIAATGGQMGVPIEKMAQFTELAGQMSTAFGLGAEQAGQSVATLANTFGLPLEQVETLGNAISVLGSTTSASTAGIVDVLTRIGGSASQFGLSAEQAAALGTAMLSLGGTTESAGAGINTMLSKLQSANVQGKDFQDALAGMGVSAQQLAQDINANPQEALTGFLRTLEQLDGQSRTEALTKMFGAEVQGDISHLLGGLGQYETALANVANGAKTAGAMQADFRKHAETTEAQINLLKESVGVLGTNLGTILLPAIKPVISGLVDITGAMAKFAEENPTIAGLAGALVAAAASAGSLRSAWGAMSTVGVQSFGAASGALKDLSAGLEAALANAGRVGAGLKLAGSVAAAGWVGWEIGTYLKDNFEEVELAGIALAAGLTKTAARAQAAWEMLKAPFTDDTIAAAAERLEVKLQEIDDTYAQIFADAQKGHEAQAKGANDAAAATEKSAAAAQKVAAATQEAAGATDQFRSALGNVGNLGALEAVEAQAKSTAERIAELGAEHQRLIEAGDTGKAAEVWNEIIRLSAEASGAAQASHAIQRTEAEATTAKLAELREAYKQAIAGGDTQKAAEIQQEIRVQLGLTGEQAKVTAGETAAAMNGLSAEAEGAGKAVVCNMQEAADATKGVGDSADEAAAHFGGIERTVDKAASWVAQTWDENGKLIEQASEYQAVTVEQAWLRGEAAASRYANEAIKSVYAAYQAGELHIGQLDEAANEYVQAMERIDRSQASMGLGSSAARGVENLQMRLLELNGTEEQIAAARQARDEAEVRRQIAQLDFDRQRAQVREDNDEVARLSQEISLYEKQIVLIGQFYAAEKKKKAEAKAEADKKAEESRREKEASVQETPGAQETLRTKQDTYRAQLERVQQDARALEARVPAGAATNVNIILQPGVDLSNRAQAELIARTLMPAIENLSRRGVGA